jgi:hypothetical protein
MPGITMSVITARIRPRFASHTAIASSPEAGRQYRQVVRDQECAQKLTHPGLIITTKILVFDSIENRETSFTRPITNFAKPAEFRNNTPASTSF